jgi:hypothetical protein
MISSAENPECDLASIVGPGAEDRKKEEFGNLPPSTPKKSPPGRVAMA